MKKMTIFIITLAILSSSALYADNGNNWRKNQTPFGMTVDYSIPINGTWGQDGFDDFRNIMAMRVGFMVDFGYSPFKFMAVGIEGGIRIFYFNIEDPSTGDDYGMFFDVPVRGFLRFGKGNFFVQAFGGYYLSFLNKYVQGAEVGVKISFLGIVLEGSYIFGDLMNNYSADWINKDYWRVAVGYRFGM
jgi:hypothetical protein